MSVILDNNRIIPAELQLPVPREVRRRSAKEATGLGCFFAGIAIFGLLVPYIAWILIRQATLAHPRPLVLVILTIAGLFAAGLFCLLFSLVITDPNRERRLLRKGKAVAGRVVKKRRRYWKWISSESSTCYLDYEYEHPGLARRIGSMAIERDEWNAVSEGGGVTVLCYPHRRRPTLLYEHSLFECVPAAGGPLVRQPAIIPTEELNKNTPAREYVFPPELQKPAPRRAVRRPGTLGIGLIIGRVLWCGIALIGLYTLARVPMYWLVAYRGELFEGRVDSTTINKSNHTLHYSFDIGGQRYQDYREIDLELYDQLKLGQKIPVLVRSFAKVPYSVVVFPGEGKFSLVFDAIMITLMVNLMLTLGVGYLVWFRYWGEKRLCRRGTPVVGRITGKKISGRKSISYEIHYEFEHPRLGLKSSLAVVVPLEYERAQEGEAVTILCNPRRFEHASTIYEYGNFMCV